MVNKYIITYFWDEEKGKKAMKDNRKYRKECARTIAIAANMIVDINNKSNIIAIATITITIITNTTNHT